MGQFLSGLWVNYISAVTVPIYEQIKQQIKVAILSGELQAEETLPSLRTLAKDLKISVLTVTKAYAELEQEGFVKNVQGRGCFVMGSGSELIKEQLICKVENNLTEAIKAARMANLSTEELHRLLDILTLKQMTDYLEVAKLSIHYNFTISALLLAGRTIFGQQHFFYQSLLNR